MFGGNGQAVLAQEGQLVPVAALEDDLPVDDMEKAAAAKVQGVTPLHDRPFAVGKHVFPGISHMTHEKTSDPPPIGWILPSWKTFFKNPGLEPIFWSLTSCDSGISAPQPGIFLA